MPARLHAVDNEQSMVQSSDLVLDMEDENQDSVLEFESVGPPPVILQEREKDSLG